MTEISPVSAPLAGLRVLVTRTREQASTLSNRLRELGAQPIEFPTIRIVAPQDWQPLDDAFARLLANKYDWLILTSVNGVRICMQRLLDLGKNPQTLQRIRIAAIGPATAAALNDYSLTADLVPEEYIAEGIISALRHELERQGRSLAGQRILLARAAEARKVLRDDLLAAGALIDEVAAYETVTAAHDDEQGQLVQRLLRERQLDILTFTSSSTVRNFILWLKGSTVSLEQVKIACIGPITARTARDLGLHVTIEAQEFTIEGLVQAILEDR